MSAQAGQGVSILVKILISDSAQNCDSPDSGVKFATSVSRQNGLFSRTVTGRMLTSGIVNFVHDKWKICYQREQQNAHAGSESCSRW